jgi:hypothetical protein
MKKNQRDSSPFLFLFFPLGLVGKETTSFLFFLSEAAPHFVLRPILGHRCGSQASHYIYIYIYWGTGVGHKPHTIYIYIYIYISFHFFSFLKNEI